MRPELQADLRTIALTASLISFSTALPTWAAVVSCGIWLTIFVAPLVLDWMFLRDRDERFASKTGAVRRDLLKLYNIDQRSSRARK
ncbi:hypothetical protein [Streptosporangium saharense]|uniref:hypothetical protein n=1 Tax=Streptosporangium saharense TaxID=1706840 RepID=UPI003430F72F